MLRLKPFLNLVISRIHNNVYKLYSKAAEQPEAALSLTDDLGAQTEGTDRTTPAIPIASNTTKSTSIVQASAESQQCAESGEGGDKQLSGCKKQVGPKGKKGKKCGQPKPVQPQDPGPPGGNYIVDKCDRYEIPKTNSKKWKAISYTLIPLALGLSAFVLATRKEGPEPEYIPYEYMYTRTKPFPWRDGKTSLFHGPYNLIPEEEEERIDREEEEKQAQIPPPKKGEKAPPPPPKEKEARYKKHVNEEEEKIKKREQHAQEELERRKKRHEEERAAEQVKEKEQSQSK